jgi:predicted transposase YbfD/YdcC
MDALANGDFLRFFGELDDPRAENRRYLLCDIIALAVAAVMCGCEGWREIAEWTEDAFEFLRPLLVRPERGCPGEDTFRRVLSRVSPEGFERCFVAWTGALSQSRAPGQIAIDGKALRQSFQHAWDRSPIHLVSAFATDNQLILGQLKVDSKANEIVAIPRLLELLKLRRATVTIDAIGCQRQIAAQIRKGQGHYLLAVKENQSALHQQVKGLMDEQILEQPEGMFTQTEGDHGRIETRRVWVSDAVKWVKGREQWPDLRQLVAVECLREVGEKVSCERRYFIASHRKLDPERAGAYVRGHWGIENRVHWVLDVTFNEDASRIRKDDGAENFSRLRRAVLNKLRAFQDPSGRKLSVRLKRKKCSWRFDYFLKVLMA